MHKAYCTVKRLNFFEQILRYFILAIATLILIVVW